MSGENSRTAQEEPKGLPTSAQDVVYLLKKCKLRISFAESCTGGMVSAAITEVDGASEVLDMSIVTYANWAKTAYTDVTEEVLTVHGAVSGQTALMMAAGIRKRSGADIGVGITGIAGPGGGSPEKPVGTVYIAVDPGGALEVTPMVRHFAFSGERNEVRIQTLQQTLTLLSNSIESIIKGV